MRILLVEDEPRIAKALCGILRAEKYQVDHFADGTSGLAAIETGVYDLLLLDVMLPGMDGVELARRARGSGIDVPILMLTAKGALEDKVLGLDSGADDYLTKPFMTEELLARIRALGRRRLPTAEGRKTYGDIALDGRKLELHCTANGNSVRVSEKEYHILDYLISHQGQIMTKESLAVKIWGFENEAEYNNVEVYMSFTRKKLAFVGARTKIQAVRGVGYTLRWEDV